MVQPNTVQPNTVQHRAAKELLLQTTKHGMRGNVSWAGFSELMVSVVWPVMI